MRIGNFYRDRRSGQLFVVVHVNLELNVLYMAEKLENYSNPKILYLNDFKELMIEKKYIQVDYKVMTKTRKNTKTSKKKLEADWLVLKYIYIDNKLAYFNEIMREELLLKTQKKFGVSRIKINRVLSRYFWGGFNKNALLDKRYFNPINQRSESTNTYFGRPNVYKNTHKMRFCEEDEKTIETFIERTYYPTTGLTKENAYQLYLMKHHSKIVNGEVVRNEIYPTRRQFLYRLDKYLNPEKFAISRTSKSEVMRNRRTIEGSSRDYALEAGFLYQIDSTPIDIFIVDSITRSTAIGCPTLYFVIDVYTRLIVSLHLTLENASYQTAMLAVSNIIEDKVDYCMSKEIDIESSEWPNSCLPSVLVADNAELKGELTHNLITKFNVTVENTVAYRPDLKGNVEREFRSCMQFLSGLVSGQKLSDHKVRGSKDYSKDAQCTLYELEKHIIRYVLYHNNKVIDGYIPTEEMVIDEIESIPSEMWRYHQGVVNQEYSLEYFRKSLLYPETGSVTREGVSFKGMKYSIPEVEKKRLYRSGKAFKVSIRYDPRNLNYIYLIRDSGEIVPIKLLDKYRIFSNKSIDEIRAIKKRIKEININGKDESDLLRLQFVNEIFEEGLVSKQKKNPGSIISAGELKSAEKRFGRDKAHEEIGDRHSKSKSGEDEFKKGYKKNMDILKGLD